MPEEEHDIGKRGFWSGTISFGLVSIPVALFPGDRHPRVSLRMLAPDGTPLHRRYFCSLEDKPLKSDEIIRGYEYEKDTFVPITDEELEALEPEKSREIDLRRFVPSEQINPLLFDGAYFFVPTGDSRKAYRLLAHVLEKTGKAGIATFVMRSKEYLIAILAENGILRAETLRFADEIRPPEEIEFPASAEVSASVLKEMKQAIKAAAADEIDQRAFEDRDSEKLLELIERKKAAGEGIVHPPEETEEEEARGGKVIDIMEALKRSIQRAGSGGSATRKHRTASPPKKRTTGGKMSEDRSERALREASRKELYARAKQLDIPGRSEMNRDELIEAIRNAAKG